jgi:YaiO family outer membrane protein
MVLSNAHVSAQSTPPVDASRSLKTSTELGGSVSDLSDGNAAWRDVSLRGVVSGVAGGTANWELANQNHFQEQGQLIALSFTRDLSVDIYTSIGTSYGTARYMQQYKFDASIHHKWLEDKQWVTGLGLSISKSQDNIHRDRNIQLTTAYYFSQQPLVAEGGIFVNASNPGNVSARRAFAAGTWGREKAQYITARIESGQEGYLSGGSGVSQQGVAFSSSSASLGLRRWMSPDFGFNIAVEAYRNPFYKRSSFYVGLFLEY